MCIDHEVHVCLAIICAGHVESLCLTSAHTHTHTHAGNFFQRFQVPVLELFFLQ